MTDHAPTNPPDSTRSVLGDFLKFIGLMLTVGGSLAVLRTLGVGGRWFGGPQFFFTLLIPIGLGVWGLGFHLNRHKGAGPGAGDHG